MTYLSPLEMLYKWEQEKPNEIYLSQPIDGTWHNWTWKEFGIEVRKMANYLKSLDLPKDSKVALLSKNCAHWMMTDMAIMMSGHISVPFYPNLNAETLGKILTHSESKLLFVGKLDNFNDMKSGIPADMDCITFPFYAEDYQRWDELTKEVDPMQENVIRDPNELATIIYTSGTTGDPKGVMHKFFNFSFATTNAVNTLHLENEVFFSYLPLCHIAERLLVQMGSLYSGGRTYFAESLDTFASNLAEASPTVFLGVPRIWTKFQQGILTKLPQRKLNILLSVPFLSSLIKKKIKKGLGLSKAKNIFTGAAPTPVVLIRWFARLGIHIQEAYAMTENTCYSHVSYNNNINVGYVGQALPECDVKLSERNEILIKHDALMDGYYKMEEETNKTIVDGWLHTGDEGEIDTNGFLKITGRVKDLFKTSKGKYVAPSPIEMKLSANKNIEQVCVVGTEIPQPIAVIVLSERGKNQSKVDLTNSLTKTLDIVNPKLDGHEKIHNFVVVKEEWTVENKLLTPTMKIKRNAIEKLYKENYSFWYEGERVVLL
ncbi:MAG TPA: AMP-binding protein [Flavobacteriales bacterium]|jgi:long-chain acyl-CoA synthetase|nr:AMP-binding protein [Flavobacteriales bacterium]